MSDSLVLFRQSKCWACGDQATVRYVAPDEPEMPGPEYCEQCVEKYPPMPGIWRVRL